MLLFTNREQMTKDKITTVAFILSLVVHTGLLSSFSLSYLKPEQQMIIEMASIEIEPPPPVEEVVIEEEKPPPIEPEVPPPELEPEPVLERVPETKPILEKLSSSPEIVKEIKEDVFITEETIERSFQVASLPMAEALPQPQLASPDVMGSRKDFLALVRRRIEWAKYYPRWARERELEGMVEIEFIIRQDGGVDGARIVGSSGHKILDKAALTTIERASPFPGLPRDIGESLKITVPIVYKLVVIN